MSWDLLFYGILNALFTLLVSPLFISLIKKVKAATQKRKGPPLLQTYYNLAKLFKKETVYSQNSSWIMKATPIINIAALITASLFVPMLFIPQPTDLVGNIILFIYLLALAKFFMALSGLDAGSTFGGMGSSREMAISALIEPITIIVFAALAIMFKTTSIPDIFRGTLNSSIIVDPVLILIAFSLFIIIIVESSRVPVDNPETHLELTMIHEAMILEQSGKNLALMELSSAMKQLLLCSAITGVLLFPEWNVLHADQASIAKPASAGFVNDWLRSKNDTWEAFDIGGQFRTRFEYRSHLAVPRNPGTADFRDLMSPDENSYWLFRTRAHMGFKPTDWVGVYLEGRDSFSESDARTPDLESDRLDLHQGYITLGNPQRFPITAKVGRQELIYGRTSDRRF
jgi:formate hydrogenlyase subunit 4